MPRSAHRTPESTGWTATPLEPLGNDLWSGLFEVDRPGLWSFRIEAWVDRVASFQDELRRKVAAGQTGLAGELSEGELLLGADDLTVEDALAAAASDRSEKAWSPTYAVDVDRVLARFGSWYELFPRSWGGFSGVRKLLPQFAELGFDVLYLPPIHPIGHTNRKGPNNSETASPGDVGSPWAIGSEKGGHTAIDPSLGTEKAFRKLVADAKKVGIEIALDFAHPVLARPPVAEGASRLVLPPAGRHAEVRREPAQALPGHLQRRFRQRRLARPLGGAARDRPPLGRLRGHGVPRRQPAHEAGAVLGVADP